MPCWWVPWWWFPVMAFSEDGLEFTYLVLIQSVLDDAPVLGTVDHTKGKNRPYSSIFLKLSHTRWISNECLEIRGGRCYFCLERPSRDYFLGGIGGMMTYITTGAGGGADLGFAQLVCALPLLHKPFFLPLRTFRAKSEPTDPGCWGESRLGKYRGLC